MKQVTVTCNSCKKKYKGYGFGTVRAEKCSATLTQDNIIFGHSGSKIAARMSLQITKKPNWVESGVICDECIAKLQKEKRLKHLSTNEFF